MNIQAHRAEYLDVEGLRGLYRQECEASPSLLAEVRREFLQRLGSSQRIGTASRTWSKLHEGFVPHEALRLSTDS